MAEPTTAPTSEHRIRITSVVGTLASIAIVVGFFLPWVEIEKEEAERYRVQLEARLDRTVLPAPDGVPTEDWKRLATLVAEQGHVTGLDVFYWARTATVTADAYGRHGVGDETSLADPLPRGIHLVAIVLAALPVAALLLAFYFLLVFLRRAHSPALVIAVLDGATAVSMLAAYGIVKGGLGVPSAAGVGLTSTGLAGALLLLAGVFGVRLRNWWRVFLGAALLGGGLALVAWSYVRGP